jgi:hypothetical protein
MPGWPATRSGSSAITASRFAGIGVVVGHDLKTDTFRDVAITLDELQAGVTWSQRIFRGTTLTTSETPGAVTIKIEAKLPKIDRE